MKKRKSPVLLLSVLLLLVAGAVMFGMSQGGGDKPLPPPIDEDQLGQGREAPTADEVAARVKSTTADGPKAPGVAALQGPKPGQAPAMPKPTGPSIAVSTKPHVLGKPTPNPSGSTSSQWYNH